LHSKESSQAEQVWLKCVCHQIPTHIHNPTLAKRLLDLVTQQPKESTSSCLDEEFLEKIWKEMNEHSVGDSSSDYNNEHSQDIVIRALVERLDSYLGNGYNQRGTPKRDKGSICDARNEAKRNVGVSRNILLQARRWLRSQQDQSTNDHSKPETRNQSTPTRNQLIRKNPSPTVLPNDIGHSPAFVNPPQSFSPKQLPAWIATTLQRLVVPIATWTKKLQAHKLQSGKDDPRFQLATRRHVQQVFLSVVLFWAGWRGRRLLAHCGTAVVWATLSE